jgi:hypothetical protein
MTENKSRNQEAIPGLPVGLVLMRPLNFLESRDKDIERRCYEKIYGKESWGV